MSFLFIEKKVKSFFECLVSSQTIISTSLRISNARSEISFKFPIGVATMYRADSK